MNMEKKEAEGKTEDHPKTEEVRAKGKERKEEEKARRASGGEPTRGPAGVRIPSDGKGPE